MLFLFGVGWRRLIEIGAVSSRPPPQPSLALHPGMMAGTESFFPVGNLEAVWMRLLVPGNEWPQVWPTRSLSQWTSLLEAALISCPAGVLRAATPLSQTATLTETYSKIPRLARAGILGKGTRTLSCFLSFTGPSLKAGPRSTGFWVNDLFSVVVKSLSWSETKMGSSPASANYLENGTNEPVSTSGGGFNERMQGLSTLNPQSVTVH